MTVSRSPVPQIIELMFIIELIIPLKRLDSMELMKIVLVVLGPKGILTLKAIPRVEIKQRLSQQQEGKPK